jgi:hypothetical protein
MPDDTSLVQQAVLDVLGAQSGTVVFNPKGPSMTSSSPQRQLTPTQNPDWGFWGTMAAQAPAAWPEALSQIAQATGEAAEAVRAFLDSRHGRHFANHVLDQAQALPLPQAIAKATQAWMAWSISRQTSSATGIPRGLPYLTGFVIQEALAEEMATT